MLPLWVVEGPVGGDNTQQLPQARLIHLAVKVVFDARLGAVSRGGNSHGRLTRPKLVQPSVTLELGKVTLEKGKQKLEGSNSDGLHRHRVTVEDDMRIAEDTWIHQSAISKSLTGGVHEFPH